MNRKIFIQFLICFIWAVSLQAQPFAGEIAAFKKADAANPPPEGAILFVGSSSFTNWKDVQAYFPEHKIINRGFGGSSLTDVIYYENDVIFPYNPRQIVIYCGENDIAGSDTVTAAIVLKRFQHLFSDIRNQWPSVPVVFISIKPSPSRWHMRDRMIEANQLISKYLNREKKAKFVSVWNEMLGNDGTPDKSIFIQDNLHMNAKGYAIWQKKITPHLIKQKKKRR